MELSLTSRTVADTAVVEVHGEVDVHSAPALRDSLTELLGAGGTNPTVVVDLSDVSFLDSTGLGTLVAGLNRAKELGGSLPLVCQQDRILKLFRITGLDSVFSIYPTVDAAASA